MGTKIKNLERYLDLWQLFEIKLKEKNLNLSSFSKSFGEMHTSEENDYEKIYPRLKKLKSRKDTQKIVHLNTIKQFEEYLRFLDTNYVIEEMRDDESYEHWFDN